jgi:DNA-binding ferritin-like protein
MTDKTGRKELEQRLEQARRLAGSANDSLTKERLAQLIRDLEEQLR